jgi:hypothetical protein
VNINPYPVLVTVGVLMCATVVFAQASLFDTVTAKSGEAAETAAKLTPAVAESQDLADVPDFAAPQNLEDSRAFADGLASNMRVAAADIGNPADR